MKNYLRTIPERFRAHRFERQLEAMLPQLFKLGYALTNKSEDAEDLVHDACVKALTSHPKARLPDAQASVAWVRSILVNCFRDRYRRQQRSRATFEQKDADNIIEFSESADLSPEDWAAYSDLESAARAAIRSLPPEVRIVITLYTMDGKSYKEIAEIVECPLGTVMSRLARGRRLLEEMLDHHVGKGNLDVPQSVREQRP